MFNSLFQYLCCPNCHGSLSFDTEQILCQECQTHYAYVAGKPNLIPFRFRQDLERAYHQQHGSMATHALTDKISRHVRQVGKAIRAFAHAVRPPDPWGHYGRARFIAQLFPTIWHLEFTPGEKEARGVSMNMLIFDYGC